MNNTRIDWQFLRYDTRARVYMLWAALSFFGFAATHLYQRKQINGFWFALSVIGLFYMYKVMPLQVRQMKRIFVVWLAVIGFGMAVSGLVFYWQSPLAAELITRLGGFWLLVMAIGYAWNGLVDPPATWYWFAAALNVIFGLLCLTLDGFLSGQYLIAAVVSAWSMLYLWLFRTEF